MVFVTFLLFIITTLSYAGNQIIAKIHAIDRGLTGEETLVFLTSGHVARSQDEKIIARLERAQNKKNWVRFNLNDSRIIESFDETESRFQTVKHGDNSSWQEVLYEPTLVENMTLANEYFREAKYVTKESQCFNRAHIWSYEWFINHAINSNKTWIFFTRRYIRKFKFQWWFHVSPSIQVMENDFPREKVMDVKYARGPLDIKRWSNIFMKDKASCPIVSTYSDYANYPESGSCFIMKTSMFYYQPFDIESKETWGTMKANWYDPEVQQAYAEAFEEVR